ncbi:spore coat protein [Saliterribacillus persicus]|uniref:Coat F domain-containing protein n=1 Tax=Saliterribacillus persicus TaxID=930114 RepID=A0A368XG92_9BACI|nr:spore coat protein [Saliterribacillus persicus]RCW66983.1 coat F domain-containing protein [Saliterribacillus persicus]
MNSNSNKIQNPETPVMKSSQMSDRDFLNDMLTTEKYLTASFNYAINEASNQTIYQDLMRISEDVHQCQRDLYNTMFANGWYSLTTADTATLQQSYQQFEGYKQQLPLH